MTTFSSPMVARNGSMSRPMSRLATKAPTAQATPAPSMTDRRIWSITSVRRMVKSPGRSAIGRSGRGGPRVAGGDGGKPAAAAKPVGHQGHVDVLQLAEDLGQLGRGLVMEHPAPEA